MKTVFKVLVAEDDELIRKGIVDILSAEGYEPIEAADGAAAIEAFDREQPCFVCLDIMMPKVSGYDVCREIRRRGAHVPIIFISAKSEEIDKVIGLELGADDFIVKPFGVKEVIARIRAVTRRYLATRRDDLLERSFEIGDLVVSPSELRARRGEQVIELSLREIKILAFLANHQGEVLNREALFDHCWSSKNYPVSRTIDQHIVYLRKRIEVDPKNPRIIKTVRGIGYRYDGKEV